MRKAMYGHPTSGDDWTLYLDEVVVCRLQGDRVEGWPSLWHVKALNILVADLVVAGPETTISLFWPLLSEHIIVDAKEEPGRYLGRDHIMFEFNGGRRVHMSMCDYAVSAYELYEKQFGPLKIYDTPFLSEAALTTQGPRIQGNWQGAQLNC